MNKDNNKKENNSNNINSNNIINLSNNINSNLSEINENDLNLYDLEDNKKAKHSSSFQQATEIIHSIQSFFQSFKKINNNNESLNSLNSSEKINKIKKKKSLSDTDLIIKKENIFDIIENSNMEKIKIQRSKSIPFNNTNSTQRNSCHYHKHSSLSSSITSSITSMSINHDQGRHYDSESETNDSRLEYSTPKEDDISFSFSSCQSSFSIASAFTNKMAPVINNYNSEIKNPIPLSPKSISSEKTELLSVTPHITGVLEDIKEQESISETLSSTPLGNSSIILKDDIVTEDDKAKESKNKKLDINQNVNEIKFEDEEIGISKDDYYVNRNKLNCNISLLSKQYKDQNSDRITASTSSIPNLLNQNHPSPLSSSPSSLSSLEIQPIHPSSPSFSPNIKKNDNNISLSSSIIPTQKLSSSLPNTLIKSPELFNSNSIENESSSKIVSVKMSKEKSLLFSSSLNNDKSEILLDKIKTNVNKNEKESDSFESSINKILIIDNNRIDSEEKGSSNYKDIVINNIINDKNEELSLKVDKNLDEANIYNENKENNRKVEKIKEGIDMKKDNLSLLMKQDRKIIKNGSKDSYINPLCNNIINEDTLIDSENSSFLSNMINISESELTSIPTTNVFSSEIQNSYENKSSNLIIEDLDNAEEEFIQINNNELENEKSVEIKNINKSIENNNYIKKNEPIITIEDTDLPKDHEKIIFNKSNISSSNIVNTYDKENSSFEDHNINTSSNYLMKERIPNEENNNKHEIYFSKEITSTIAYNNNNEKKDEDNYSYYSNAFSPEISISSVNSDDKYSKGNYDKSQFYRKNKSGKKPGEYEKSIKEYAASLEKEMMEFYLKNVPTEESKTKKVSTMLNQSVQSVFEGSVMYSSPEVMKNEIISYESDIWALGCIIYEMIKLKPPFSGDNSLTVAKT